MQLVTVTGGAGFIGSHLADKLLAAGYAVRVLDDLSTGKAANLDPRCELIRGDVRDPATVDRAMIGAAACFHLAAIASVERANQDWIGTHQVNLGGMVNVLDASRKRGGIPVVYASSAAVYGRVDDVATEAALAAPMTAYGADKRGCELHAHAGNLVHGIPTLGFRFFNVYGPRQDPHSPYSGVISIFAERVASGAPIQVHGDGSQTRDFVFVDDIVAFLMAGLDHLRVCKPRTGGIVLNACTGYETSIVRLANEIAGAVGRAASIGHGPARPGDIKRSVGSPERARALLGIAARTPLAEGLRTTVSSLRKERLEPALP